MHVLDRNINDIEPRIYAIYTNISKQEDPSLQGALAAYGWILLDSWIAWRTLRFLMRRVDLSEKIYKKWFQTPSSYTCAQLSSAWGFDENVEIYIKANLGTSLKHVIDKTIQAKRNASAHATQKEEINGSDGQQIKNLFNVLSKLFRFYETWNFIRDFVILIEKDGYNDVRIIYEQNTDNWYSVNGFKKSVAEYSKYQYFYISAKKDSNEYILYFGKDGCTAGIEGKNLKDVVNDENKGGYDFFGNKGYYRNIDLFCSTVKGCWKY